MDRKELEVIASALFGSAKGSQSRLAEYLGVHQTTVSRYLSGDLEIPVKVENQLAARMAGRVEVGVILDELAARQMWFSSHEGFDLFPPENLRVIIGSWESIQPAEGEQATYEHESFLDAFYFSRYRQARGDQVMVAHITMPLEFSPLEGKRRSAGPAEDCPSTRMQNPFASGVL
jgi:transcriptional regulator with XRE-family HTH domain